ncbi:MAG: VCBS repeat-containing protein [Planctomycetota bacterium]|nr:VCBS repeat-containing protein [Planctomycetota bacterium]
MITNSAEFASSVYATDLDGDGDADVLSASATDDKIAWYENLGSGAFGPRQVITASANGAVFVYAADLDEDGDPDVLSVSAFDDKIAWYENLGGGSFGPQMMITTLADGARSVYATDLDGDGDADVVSASSNDDKVAWYENLGRGVFGPEQVITTSADSVWTVHATDLDGDGDADVLSASRNDDKVAWYENLGGGSFGPQRVITTSADFAFYVHATDLDGDGDADVLSASGSDDKIAWYENLGGGAFGPQQTITTSADFSNAVYAIDLDGDGDADVLSASFNDDKIAWYENLGDGTFGPQQVITTLADGARSVYATDLDGDGDADVLSASALDAKVAWHENVSPPRVVNDHCSGALPIGIGESMFSNVDASDSDIDMGCVFRGEASDVWFSYTAQSSGPVTIDLSGSSYDTGAAVWVGDCASLVQVGCDDDGGLGLTSLLSFTASAGTTYYVQVGGFRGSTGDIVINLNEGIGSIVCLGNPNSTGVGAFLEASGSLSIANNDLTLVLSDLPPNQGVLFVNSPEKIVISNPAGSQGDLCIGSFSLGRHMNDILNSGANGAAALVLDLTNIPTASGLTSAVAGERRYWQAWYRDVDGSGSATSNFSSAIGLTFN